jgi:SPX domain protein involved in polyphosphate accumulation
MVVGQLDVRKYRYERKFFISELSRQSVESIVRLHPAMFSEIFHQRFVNNIYFDSFGLQNYNDNVHGSTRRIKVRIRWYGELFGNVTRPVLELKAKDGVLGKKESYSLQPFRLDEIFGESMVTDLFASSDIPEIVKMKLGFLKPVLLNRYSRKYFQSADKRYRITLDGDLVFYRITHQFNSFMSKMKDDISVILELKYAADSDLDANHISNNFPFRVTKSSKYVQGIDKLYV